MKSSTDYKPNLSRGILLIGEAGKGKTTLMARMPGAYLADCDNNLSGPHRFITENKLPPFKYDIIDILDDGTVVEDGLHFKRLVDCVKTSSTDPDIGAIGITSLTKLSDYVMADLLKKQGRTQMQLQDWGTFLQVMKQLITKMRSTKKLFVMDAHIKAEKDDVAGFMKFKVLVPGQLQDIIGSLFSDVWLCQVEEKSGKHEWNIRTLPNTWYALKNSFGFPAVISHDTALAAIKGA